MPTTPMRATDTPYPTKPTRTAAMTPRQYSDHLAALSKRARAVTEQRRRRFRRMCREAGLDATTLHNALVGFHYGRPWKDVDYSKARRARRFQDRIFDAERIVSRYYARTCHEVARRGSDV